MLNLQRLQWLLVTVMIAISLVLTTACAQTSDQAPKSTGPGESSDQAVAEATATLSATSIRIQPTNTPPPPPPTPTPLPTPTPAPESETSDETSAPKITEAMVEIPAGPFLLGNDNGNPNEAPTQEMDLPTYMIDAFEVTNADFETFVEATGYKTYREQEGSPQNWRWAYTEGKENHPVVFVTFDDAQAFCQWAGKRLPTEYEWEKAARGPEGYHYPWGNEYDPTMFNGYESGQRGTTAVGSYPPNDYGLFDMAGNVKEWVDSPYLAYPGSNYQDGHYSPDFRGIRGGDYFDEGTDVSATHRNGGDPTITANDDIGLRCAK
jgi:formylglycine-generating enzyme required for sulfatase activity